MDYLARRGGRFRSPVRLPVIPLGVDCDSYTPGTGVALRDHAAEPARVDHPDPFAIYRGYPSALLGPGTVVAARSDDPAADLARLREGELHGFADYAFLPDADADALMARLAASGPTRAADLAAAHPSNGRKLVRTLLWLKKFDLVEFAPEPQAR